MWKETGIRKSPSAALIMIQIKKYQWILKLRLKRMRKNSVSTVSNSFTGRNIVITKGETLPFHEAHNILIK